MLRGYAELVKGRIALEFGEIAPIPETSGQSPSAQRSPAAAASIDRPTTPLPLTTEPSFFAHWEAFVANKLRIEEWSADMPANAAVARTVFTALKGSLTPSALTKKIASEFRDALFELPRLYDKDRRWRDLPLAEVAAAVVEYRKRDPNFNVILISKTTVNKHLTDLDLLELVQRQRKNSGDPKNPFLKLASKRARGKSAREARPQWPEELEKALFTSPVWTGCQSLHRRTKAGASIFRDALFWVPLLCRTFGARSDEICSRKVGDIKFATDGIAYLEIRNSKSRRLQPRPAILRFHTEPRLSGAPLFRPREG